jgi:transaldolase
MNVMSAETRSMVAATMFVALGEMKAHMDVLQQIVENEVRRQFELQTMDLRTLYSCPRRRDEVKQRPSSSVAPERNLADALGLDDAAADVDLGEDEVF